MNRTALPALLIIGALALAGCGGASSGHPADHRAAPSSTAATSITQPPAGGSAFTIEYENGYRTVVTFTAEQLGRLTGQRLETGTVEAVTAALGKAQTWTAQGKLSRYADQLTGAARAEQSRIKQTLGDLVSGKADRLRVHIGHNRHETRAHFGTEHG
ncbi:hypothetical protein [Sciscionella marina]|uniref:hypothetical protein n=1 Tax=Sciscionella marina TaxID=508770 RepID=UPI000365BFD5|nr:hypothetical protein [Sciscionella marina]